MFGCTAFLAVVINLLPYFFSGETAKFFAGLSLMLADTIPSSPHSIMKRQIYYALNSFTPTTSIIFVIFVPVGICLAAFNSVYVFRHDAENKPRKITSVILVLCCLLIPSMLQFTFLTKHYWEHYAQMFTPFAAINVGWLLTLPRPNMPTFSGLSDQGNKYIINFFIVVGTIGLFQGEILKDLKLTLALVSKTDVANGNEIRSLDSFKEFKKHGFFAPYSMKIHWLSKESRYGFPHQAHTRHIERGRWENVAIPPEFHFPKTSREYCEKLMTLEAKFVIVPRGSVLNACLDSKKIKILAL